MAKYSSSTRDISYYNKHKSYENTSPLNIISKNTLLLRIYIIWFFVAFPLLSEFFFLSSLIVVFSSSRHREREARLRKRERESSIKESVFDQLCYKKAHINVLVVLNCTLFFFLLPFSPRKDENL